MGNRLESALLSWLVNSHHDLLFFTRKIDAAKNTWAQKPHAGFALHKYSYKCIFLYRCILDFGVTW